MPPASKELRAFERIGRQSWAGEPLQSAVATPAVAERLARIKPTSPEKERVQQFAKASIALRKLGQIEGPEAEQAASPNQDEALDKLLAAPGAGQMMVARTLDPPLSENWAAAGGSFSKSRTLTVLAWIWCLLVRLPRVLDTAVAFGILCLLIYFFAAPEALLVLLWKGMGLLPAYIRYATGRVLAPGTAATPASQIPTSPQAPSWSSEPMNCGSMNVTHVYVYDPLAIGGATMSGTMMGIMIASWFANRGV